jgi:DNA-binding PadR family transcriptional regulator
MSKMVAISKYNIMLQLSQGVQPYVKPGRRQHLNYLKSMGYIQQDSKTGLYSLTPSGQEHFESEKQALDELVERWERKRHPVVRAWGVNWYRS